MDRRNGGDHQAPPRPPKLLPRIHRPRAPDPMEVLNDISSLSRRSDRREEVATVGFGTNNVSGIAGIRTTLTDAESTATTATATTITTTKTVTPRCTNSDQQQHLDTNDVSKQQLEKSEQKQQREQLNSITTTASTTIRTASIPTPTSTSVTTLGTTAPKTSPTIENPLAYISNNINTNTSTSSSSNSNSNSNSVSDISSSSSNTTLKNNKNISNSNNSNKNNDNGISSPGTFVIHNHLFSDPNLLAGCPDYENYQIYHLTYLPQRPSNLSVSSLPPSSSSITAANSFTRRRPQPGTPGAADTPWRISGNTATPTPTATPTTSTSTTNNNSSSSSSSFGSFFSHFQHADNTSASPVTLAQPRPESQRLTNEYVDTPLRTTHHLQNASRTQHPAGQQDNNQTTTHHVLLLPQRELLQYRTATDISGTTTAVTATLGIDGTDGFLHSQNQKPQASLTQQVVDKVHAPSPPPRDSATAVHQHQHLQHQQQHHQQQQHQQLPPITKQPAPAKCKSTSSEVPNIQLSNTSPNSSPIGTPIIIAGSLGSTNSITCPRCGLCRCEQCKSSGLPQKWLCKKSCLCSAESVMDYATCLCCAKAIFYHCATQGDMDDEEDYVDDPCSCAPRKRLQRWGWLGALSLVLPCLWCYWPMRGCTWLCEKCYNRFAGRGCRCQQNTTSNMLPIMPLASHGNNADANSNIQGANSSNHLSNVTAKSKGNHGHHYHHHHHHYHHHHHHGDSVASRMLRKGDITPEKRLLDTNMDY